MRNSATIEIPRQAGLHVRRKREEQGLTRAQLAQMAGVSERLLASLELGDATGIRLDKLLAVLKALGLSLAVQDMGPAAGRSAPSRAESSTVQEAKQRQAPAQAQNSSRAADKAGAGETPSPDRADNTGSLLTTYDALFRKIASEQTGHGMVTPLGEKR